MPITSETVTLAGSGLVFQNSYDPSVTDGYRAAILTAENYLQNDALFGDDGGDIVYGNLGNDSCDGGAGDDLIRGGQGDDVLTGGDGADWISGDRGSDTMTGGAGADIFHSFSGAGIDVVTDFNPSDGDRVQLDTGTIYTLRQSGADTVVDMGNGDELVLKNVTLSRLPPSWIFTA